MGLLSVKMMAGRVGTYVWEVAISSTTRYKISKRDADKSVAELTIA